MTRRTSSRPVMRVLDALGRRWALRILWELRDGPLTFRALRDACDGVSPSSLNHRLADLRALGAVERGDGGYGLTRDGARLTRIVLSLHRWAERRPELRRDGAPAAPRAGKLQPASHKVRVVRR